MKKIIPAAIALFLVIAVLGIIFFIRYGRDLAAPSYGDESEHFKYGSIGAEVNGYPYLVWRELPSLFTAELPHGWKTFGFIQENPTRLPVGISIRRYGIERVGFNCATCHTSRVDGNVHVLLGAPAYQLDLQRYLRFLIKSSQDPKFTADRIFEAAETNRRPFDWLDRLVFRYYVIPKISSQLLTYEQADGAWMKNRPDHGPGRTDAGNPWRVRFGMHPERDQLSGAVDMPSLWQQRLREKVWMHWDGNNASLTERNISAALAGGATEESLDHAAIQRVAAWSMNLPPPSYPYPISPALAAQGRQIYQRQLCASCHDAGEKQFGLTTKLSQIGTDTHRVALFTKEMVAAFGQVGSGKPWQFQHYRVSDGYANAPLDGIWARAPYLHNGSVSTLHDLLLPQDQRAVKFYKGCEHYDAIRVGYSCPSGFLFDTTLAGNSNTGHAWGAQLDDTERAALIEYMKTL